MLHCYILHVFCSYSTYICCLWSNIIRKHVSLNGWLMIYGTMRWTLLYLMKCLGCFTWKNNSLTSSSVMIYSHQSYMLFTLENLIHMLLLITLSFVKLLWHLLEAFHAIMIKITYTPPSYTKPLHWKLATSIHPQKIYTPVNLWISLPSSSFKRDMG
jgi:hypothetical protein